MITVPCLLSSGQTPKIVHWVIVNIKLPERTELQHYEKSYSIEYVNM